VINSGITLYPIIIGVIIEIINRKIIPIANIFVFKGISPPTY